MIGLICFLGPQLPGWAESVSEAKVEEATSIIRNASDGLANQLVKTIDEELLRITNAKTLKKETSSKRIIRDVAPGIRHVHWHIVKSSMQEGPWNFNLLIVNLAEPGVEVQVVPAKDGLEKTSSICKRVGAFAAINGGFFDSHGPTGLVVVDGVMSSTPPLDLPPRATLGIRDRVAWMDLVSVEDGKLKPVTPNKGFDWNKAQYVLGGGPRIINGMQVGTGGKIDAAVEGFGKDSNLNPDEYTPRTVVGIGRNRLYLLTVDGDQPDLSIGMTLAHAAGVMIRLCSSPFAMALAGDDATTFVIEGKVINFPSGKSSGEINGEIPVANAICVFRRSSE